METVGVATLTIFVEEVAELLTEVEIAAIWGVLGAGESQGASEDYDYQRDAFLEGHIPTAKPDVVRALRSRPHHLRRGLERLGQLTLLQALDELVPPDVWVAARDELYRMRFED